MPKSKDQKRKEAVMRMVVSVDRLWREIRTSLITGGNIRDTVEPGSFAYKSMIGSCVRKMELLSDQIAFVQHEPDRLLLTKRLEFLMNYKNSNKVAVKRHLVPE